MSLHYAINRDGYGKRVYLKEQNQNEMARILGWRTVNEGFLLHTTSANSLPHMLKFVSGKPCTRPILRNTRRTLYEADSQEYKANLVREGRVVIEVKYIVLGNWELGTRLKYKNRPSRLDNPGGLSKYHRFFTHPWFYQWIKKGLWGEYHPPRSGTSGVQTLVWRVRIMT